MHSGRYTVSTESHCDRALIVKAHSQQCAMEGTTVILDVTDSNGLTLTLRETAKITPGTSLYTTQPPCLLQKKKPKCSLHYKLSFVCSAYSPPEEQTKQQSFFFVSSQRKKIPTIQPRLKKGAITSKRAHFVKAVKKQTYALNPSELMLVSVLTTSELRSNNKPNNVENRR